MILRTMVELKKCKVVKGSVKVQCFFYKVECVIESTKRVFLSLNSLLLPNWPTMGIKENYRITR